MPTDPDVSSIYWINPERELPDDEETVLIALSDGEIWTGFYDAGDWRFVSSDLVEDAKVNWWAKFPEPPKSQ